MALRTPYFCPFQLLLTDPLHYWKRPYALLLAISTPANSGSTAHRPHDSHKQFPWSTPMHPCSAIAIAILLSVTVSIAAEANGNACHKHEENRGRITQPPTINKRFPCQNVPTHLPRKYYYCTLDEHLALLLCINLAKRRPHTLNIWIGTTNGIDC